MKNFLKMLWGKITFFIGQYNWALKLFQNGMNDLNTKNDKLWALIPTIFTHYLGDKREVGIAWFGIGVKLVRSAKPMA